VVTVFWVLAASVPLGLAVQSASPPPAQAGPVAGLQAEATVLSERLVEEQLSVGAFQQQESVDSARVSADAAAILAGEQQNAATERQIASYRSEVRAQAITDYMDSGAVSSGSDALLFSGGGSSAQALSEYQGIATGQIATALDRLQHAQRSLAAAQGVLETRQAADRSAQAGQAAALAGAVGAERQLEADQSQVTGQLAAAVAQQAAARAAAAAAAVRAAQAAAARAIATRSAAATSGTATGAPGTVSTTAPPVATAPGGNSAPPAGPSSGTATTDPALNPFLQCVVQAESGGDYGAVSPNGLYLGAFQFSQPTWNTAAVAAGLPGLVGVPPNLASKADQDTVAVALYALDGEQPWLDRCHS